MRAAREADAAYARQQAERAKTLLDAGAVSQQELEQAQTLQKTAEAQLKARRRADSAAADANSATTA